MLEYQLPLCINGAEYDWYTSYLFRENNKREGEMLREKALEEAEELKQKEASERDRARKAHEETLDANRALQVFKLKELEREKQAEQAILGAFHIFCSVCHYRFSWFVEHMPCWFHRLLKTASTNDGRENKERTAQGC